MKLLLALLLSASPYFVAATKASDRDVERAPATVEADVTVGFISNDGTSVQLTGDGQDNVHVVRVDGNSFAYTDANGEEHNIDVSVDGNGESHARAIFIKVDKDGGDDHTVAMTHMMRFGEDENAASRGWLGVSIGQVSKSLADQLGVGDRGVLVLNVIKGSPAERAGLEAHDVILTVDGEAISGDVKKTVEIGRASCRERV